MSQRFPGGFLTQSPPTPSASNTTGVWTLDQQEQLRQSGQWPPNGPFFIEDVFSTWLYTGNGTSQTINNGIDLAGKGGLVWIKQRNFNQIHVLVDTVRGNNKRLQSNSTAAEDTTSSLMSFNANGFSVPNNYGITNSGDQIYASWTFRKQPKFFDVVTYTGNGVLSNAISHNLGSVPGCIIWKRTDSTSDWGVWHIANGITTSKTGGSLNSTNAFLYTLNATPYQTSTTFQPAWVNDAAGNNGNINGATYVAYLFAHNAGGFGLSGTDNVISCGSFTTDGNGTIPETNLGYEPQYVMFKASSTTGAWTINDTMRGQPTPTTANGSAPAATLYANNANAESQADSLFPTSTGFRGVFAAVVPSTIYIYIAIRRGPMRTPTTGTSVFKPLGNAPASTDSGVGFPADMSLAKAFAASQAWLISPRLTSAVLYTNSTAAEGGLFGTAGPQPFDTQDGFKRTTIGTSSYAFWAFKRAPGFMDVCCYTGSGTTTTQSHNLGVVPELIIVKSRSGAANWQVYSATYGRNFYAFLDLTQGFASDPGNAWGTTNPTSTTFGLSPLTETNASGSTYVAYLFASVPGVSKVGSYTGTGTTQTINCGFTGGARFVMIKRADSTGDWFVWDTARGMIPANDPYLLLNSAAAEVTGTDFVDTAATGFEITSTAPAAINASGGTFIFLAIA